MRRLAVLLFVTAALAAGIVAAQEDSEYRVRYGDTLDVIAQELDVSVACLAGANDLTNANQLSFGQRLVVPADCDPYDSMESIILSNIDDLGESEPEVAGLGRGGGRAADDGDADDEEDDAAEADGQGGGATAAAADEDDDEEDDDTPTLTDEVYVVQRNDNLTRIAEEFGVTAACIQRANAITDPDLIYVGQELLISADCQGGGGGGDVLPGAARQCFGDRNAGRVVRGGTYVVQEGDTLDFIACDLNLSTSCLVALNQLPNRGGRLEIGQRLQIDSSCAGWTGPPGPGDLNR